MDQGINLVPSIYFAQATKKTCGQVAIPHPPFLYIPSPIFRLLALSFIIKIICKGMRETIVQTHIGLEVVVNEGSLDSIENGIDMSLPKVGRFKIPKRSYILGSLVHDKKCTTSPQMGGVSSVIIKLGMASVEKNYC